MLNKSILRMNLQFLASDGDNDDITELRTKYTELENKLNEQITQYNDLNAKYSVALENNQKLFLNQTAKIDTINKDEEKVNEYEEYIGEEIYNLLSKGEQKILETILEGED